MEIHIKMDDLGGNPPFSETPIPTFNQVRDLFTKSFSTTVPLTTVIVCIADGNSRVFPTHQTFGILKKPVNR